jgi:hypothetical protein
MRVLAPLALVAVLLLLPAGAAAAHGGTTSFELVGYEYSFTSTVGRFLGTASGAGVDAGAWKARVVHDKLGSKPTYVDGGSFRLALHSSGLSVNRITGAFAEHGGTIRTLDSGRNCANQRYAVAGRLRAVSGPGLSGSGDYALVLTHYRASVIGHCIAYKARVTGTVRFSS